MKEEFRADSEQKMQDIHEYIFYELRNHATCPHCKKLYSRILAHLLWCLENPERKLERHKCPGCDKIYSDSKRMSI